MKILVLSMEEKGAMGVTRGEGVSPTIGMQMCQAATTFLQGQAIEAEVQRRLVEAQGAQEKEKEDE